MLNSLIRKNNFIDGRERFKKWKGHGKIDIKLWIKNNKFIKRFSNVLK